MGEHIAIGYFTVAIVTMIFLLLSLYTETGKRAIEKVGFFGMLLGIFLVGIAWPVIPIIVFAKKT